MAWLTLVAVLNWTVAETAGAPVGSVTLPLITLTIGSVTLTGTICPWVSRNATTSVGTVGESGWNTLRIALVAGEFATLRCPFASVVPADRNWPWNPVREITTGRPAAGAPVP